MSEFPKDVHAFETMTDEDICDYVRRGCEAGMDYLLNKYKTMVRAKARTCFIMGGDQDDLIQVRKLFRQGMIPINFSVLRAIFDFAEREIIQIIRGIIVFFQHR